jgi:hypothetical protein
VVDVCLKEERLEQVDPLTEPGSTIIWDGRSTSDIKHRIEQVRTALMAKMPLLCSMSVRMETRKQCLKAFVWAVAHYNSEAWAVRKTD